MSWIKFKIVKSKNKSTKALTKKATKKGGELIDSKNYFKFSIHNNPNLTDLLQCDIGRINFLTSEINNKSNICIN